MGYEAVQCYNTLRTLAQDLAKAGFHVLRVDYHGTGESAGDAADPHRLAAWVASVRAAVDALHALPEVESVGLIGLRLGATLAMTEAAEDERVGAVVLSEPCVSGAAYLRELEIVASATAAALAQGRPAPGEEPLIPGGGLLAAGYLITAETRAALAGLAMGAIVPRARPAVLLLERDDRAANPKLIEHLGASGCHVTAERAPGFKEMMVEPVRSRVPREALDRIRAWALTRSHEVGRPAGSPTLGAQAWNGSVRCRPVRFGTDDRLFGMVTEPLEGDAERPTVVFLAGGVVPRTAVNRMYVTAARALAARGHSVLRMDISGIGESPPAGGAAPNDAYAASLVPDVGSAVAWARPRAVWLVGLCSGAYGAFQAALADPRIAGVVFINPIVFHGAEGMSRDSPQVQQIQASRGYGRSFLRVSKWKKLLSGQVDLRFALRVVGGRTRAWLAARTGRGLATDLRGLLDRGTRVAIAFSDGDPGIEAFAGQVGPRLGDLERRGLVMHVFRGADHTFNPLEARAQLLDWIVARVSGTSPPSPSAMATAANATGGPR